MKSGKSLLILLIFISFCGGTTEETVDQVETTTSSSTTTTTTVPETISLQIIDCSVFENSNIKKGISNGYSFTVQIVGYAMSGIVDNKDFFAQFQQFSVSGTYDDKSFFGEFDGRTLTITGPPQAIVIGCILGFKWK